jgi:predicted permease
VVECAVHLRTAIPASEQRVARTRGRLTFAIKGLRGISPAAELHIFCCPMPIWWEFAMNSLVQDVRYSWRTLLKSPGFSVTAVLTLAMGIGANAVVFSGVNSFLLRPLKVPEEESLYAVWRAKSSADPGHGSASESYPDYVDLRDRNRSFADLAAYNVAVAGLDTGGHPSRVWIEESSGNYFDALKLQPYLGRLFHASDEHGPNSAPYIVLSYAFWHTHFQNDRGVVGRVVQVNRHPFTIIGVAPPGFHGTLQFFNPAFFTPLVNQEQFEGVNNLSARGTHDSVFMVMGHLKAGVSRTQAIADLNSIGKYLEENYPKDEGKMSFSLARPGLYGDYLGRPVQAFLTGLMLLAGLILLAACANLGSLFAARAADRSREVALRIALGASRRRILRHLFTEAVMISLAGGAVGLWSAVLLLRGLSAWQPFPRYPIQALVMPEANVYGVALLLTLASGFLFGSVPVGQILRTNPYDVVKSGSTAKVRRRITARDMLLVGQIAICAVLITSSLVAVRGLARSLHSNFGFEPQNAMLVDTDLAMGGYSGEKLARMQKRMLDALGAIPGVEAVALTDWTPLGVGENDSLVFADRTTDLRPANSAESAYVLKISPEYFRVARTSLTSGRTFTWHDDKDAPRVAVINQEFARKVFGSVSGAMGGYFKKPDGTRVQVVGIAEDGKYDSLTEDPRSAMFLPALQWPASESRLIVRSNRDPEQLAPAIRSTLRGLDASLPLTISTWDKELDLPFFGARMATKSLGVLGVMGAMLAVTGIFGMAAYSVSKRMRELGIRIALGAQRTGVLRAALGRAFKLLALGSAAGLVLGILASRVLALVVYQATPRDPLVLVGVVLAMSLLGLVATWIPARRALSVDPLILLREE